MSATAKASQRAILIVLFGLSVTPTIHSQEQSLKPNPPARGIQAGIDSRRAQCVDSFPGRRALAHFERFEEGVRFVPDLESGDDTAALSDGRCFRAAPVAPSASPYPAVMGLKALRPLSGPLRAAFPATPTSFSAPPTFPALGKEGEKIGKARESVLEILSTDNACSEWFKSRDTLPARTFESLSFQVDRRGPPAIFESVRGEGFMTLRQPYVASAIQDGGPFTTITINENGAFYRPQGRVEKVSEDGGPLHFDGMHSLTVGSYLGNTLGAQVVTLLHEFGHVIDLLPQDGDDLDGSSMRNTNEVLRHCRAEVDARAQEAKLSKSRHF